MVRVVRASTTAGRTRALGAWIFWLAVGFLAYLVRASPSDQLFTLGNEDATVFVSQPRTRGLSSSFAVAYNGYFHLVPRVGGALTRIVPIAHVPIVTYLYSASVALVAAALAYRCGRGLALSPGAALLVSAFVLVLPAGGYEMVGNLPDIEWYCLAGVVVFVAAWLTGYRPPLPATAVLLAVAGLTSPVIAIVLVFVVPVALVRRQRYDVVVAAVLLATSVVQYLARYTEFGAVGPLQPNPLLAAHLFVARVGAGSVLGDRGLAWFVGGVGASPAVEVIGVLAIVGVVALCTTLHGRDRLAGCFLLVSAGSIVALSVASRPSWFDSADLGFLPNGIIFNGRYMGVPALCLTLVAVLAIDRWRAEDAVHPRRRRVIATIGGGLAVVLLLANLRVDLNRPSRDDYVRQVDAAAETCAHSDPATLFAIHTGPFASPTGGFALILQCGQAF